MRPSASPPFHYGWIIAGTGTLIIFACLGLGRFALGMLLPSMGASLSLDYAQMGFISTGNFCGYLLAVLASGLMAARLGERRLIVAGLVLVAGSMLAVSQSQGFRGALFFYVLTGFGARLERGDQYKRNQPQQSRTIWNQCDQQAYFGAIWHLCDQRFYFGAIRHHCVCGSNDHPVSLTGFHRTGAPPFEDLSNPPGVAKNVTSAINIQ